MDDNNTDEVGNTQDPQEKAQKSELKSSSIWSIITQDDIDGLKKYIRAFGSSSLSRSDWNMRTPLGLAVSLEKLEMVKIMVENEKTDVNARDRSGNTPLHEAVEKNYIDMVKILLNTGRCNLEIKDPNGNTPLMRAVYHDYEEIAEALLSEGANPETMAAKGRTCIFICVLEGSIDCMELLLKNRCNTKCRDKYGISLLRTIFKTNSIIKPEAIKLLQQYDYDIRHDRRWLEETKEKSGDVKDRVYAEMLLENKSIKSACENPFAQGGWHRRNSVSNRRLSIMSDISLSFVYGKKHSFMNN